MDRNAKCIQKGLKKCDYSIYMDMNMIDNNNMTTLHKRGLKTRSYNMDMNKKDLKKLSKSQLKQEAKKPSNSVNVKPIPPLRTGKWESIKPKPVSRKSVNEGITLPSKQFRERPPNQLESLHFHQSFNLKRKST